MDERQQTIMLDNHPLTYSIRRSRRARRVALHVNYRTGVEVVIPWRVSYAAAHQFVEQKQDWLRQRMERYWRIQGEIPQRDFSSGSWLPRLGVSLPLHVSLLAGRRRSSARLVSGQVEVVAPEAAAVRPALVRWYRHEARTYFSSQTEQYEVRAQVQHQRIVIGDQRTQWGSCSIAGRLSFNWRLLLAPAFVADYVVAHEVAHLRHHNHSAQFWQLVNELCPENKVARLWLRRYDHTLVL